MRSPTGIATGIGAEGKHREGEELLVHLQHDAREVEADADAEHATQRPDEQGELQVVPGEIALGVAERAEDRDLGALRPHEAPHEHVQHERRDAEEDGRRHRGRALEALDLVATGSGSTPGPPGRRRRTPRSDRDGRSKASITSSTSASRPSVATTSFMRVLVVEDGLGERLAQPEDGEVLRIGQDLAAAADQVHELGAQGRADDASSASFLLFMRTRRRSPDLELVASRETVGDDHLARAVAPVNQRPA